MKKLNRITFFLIFMITACSGGSGDDGETNSLIPQIHIFPSGQEKSLISQEIIDQDNCKGSADTSQTVERSHTVLYTLELGSGIKVGVDGRAKIPEIGEVGVGAEIATNYQVGYGRSEGVSRSQTVAAAPESHIQHTIQQYEIWETGEVLIVVGDISQRLPYKFRSDFSIEIVAPANIVCPGNSIVESPDSPPESQVSTAVPTKEIEENNTTDQCFRSDWEDCWRYDDAEKIMTWIGPIQESFDIGQKGIALQKIRDGYVAVFSIQSSGTIEACVGSINGQKITGDCPIIYEVEAGDYQISSPGPSGGFRISR